MAKTPTPESIAAGLTATERVLLFCIATDTDWRKVVAVGTAQHMLIRGLIERELGRPVCPYGPRPRGARSADAEGRDAGAIMAVFGGRAEMLCSF
jgi:hypothetical protein